VQSKRINRKADQPLCPEDSNCAAPFKAINAPAQLRQTGGRCAKGYCCVASSGEESGVFYGCSIGKEAQLPEVRALDGDVAESSVVAVWPKAPLPFRS